MSMIELYDLIYSALPHSDAYGAVVTETKTNLPEWVIPLSSVDRALLERLAEAMQVGAGDTFADLACGLGGPALWIARETGASVAGIDFSTVAIAHANALAAVLNLAKQAQFYARDATRTELPDASVTAVTSIDAFQFIEPEAVTIEIGRILEPGGRAAIVTWEALTDIEIPTVVADYRPYLEAAGLAVRTHKVIEGAREREIELYRLLVRYGDTLRAQMGEAAEALLHEAENGLRREHEPPRVQKVFIVASKPRV
ncbi:MAG TPA: methyltransferase domain-containing protein [Candidatus Cybelea sp.]|jgi:ubiquinone/menaquinone biosynthesis C-methylase UbiE|nr:methyltransferase domain-containing protein [Candidatus Cybelea sp.]